MRPPRPRLWVMGTRVLVRKLFIRGTGTQEMGLDSCRRAFTREGYRFALAYSSVGIKLLEPF